MGFNTVVFLLNDRMGDIERAPRTLAWLLSHPPMSEREANEWSDLRSQLARENAEPVLTQAVKVMPTFHADEHRIFMAGGNCITQLEALKLIKTKEGKYNLVLELPEWFKGNEGYSFIPIRPKPRPSAKVSTELKEPHKDANEE